MKPMQPVRGTADLMPRQKSQMNFVVERAIMIAGRYGFQSMETPIFEFTEVFSRPLGESSDVVAKETYSFEDRGGTSLTLRPEGTASVMRALISNGLTQTLPQKFFYSGPMFRYERPQKGRMRQFHQIGCEFIGTFEPLADAEVISCATYLLSELGILDKCKLYLNSLGDDESRGKYRSVLIGYLKDYSASLSRDSQRRLALNPLRILDSKAIEDKEIIENAPKLIEFLTVNSKEHFKRVTDALEKSAITEENNAVSNAFLPFPILVNGGPSKVVATDAPVPGNETSIAGIEPPKIPPLYTPIKKGIPTKGSIKKEIGRTIAIAIKVVNPGKAPTNKPINKPKAITNIIVRKLLLPNSKGKEFKKLSNI